MHTSSVHLFFRKLKDFWGNTFVHTGNPIKEPRLAITTFGLGNSFHTGFVKIIFLHAFALTSFAQSRDRIHGRLYVSNAKVLLLSLGRAFVWFVARHLTHQ